MGLVLALLAMSYVALLPSYEFGNWVPVSLLQSLKAPESWVNHLLIHADKVAHTFGALTISLLYFLSLPDPTDNKPNPFQLNVTTFLILLFALALAAELAQLWIGRNFSFGDILAGMLGGVIATTIISRTKLKMIKAS